MMSHESGFNNEIKALLKMKGSGSAELIRTLLNGKSVQSYYVFFDNLCFKLGISFNGKMCINDKDKVVGYFPIIVYNRNNLINEVPKEDKLTVNYVSENQCYEIIAKSLVYRLMRISNIKEVIQNL